jgi:hypothetical protein
VSKTIKVQYRIGGTAKKNADYKPVSGTATILAGNVSPTVTIIPKDDRKKEPTETVVLTLKAVKKKYNVGNSNTASVGIADND